MDFSEQDVDVFGDDEERENEAGNHDSSASNSPSSSPASSSSSSSSDDDDNGDGDGDNRRDSGTSGESSSGDGSGSGSDEEGGECRSRSDHKDLFGSDDEDYMKTLAKSPFPVPTLPVIRISNNQNRMNSGRGRWQPSFSNGGRGILPRGPYHHRQPFGASHPGHRFANGRPDERLVSEMMLSMSEETLSRKNVKIQEPCELACYSRVEGGEVHFDDRCLRQFRRLVSEEVGADLNAGFETFIEKRDTDNEGFGDLLASIRNKKIPLQNIHFVTFRNNLNKIMATAYNRLDPWEMGVHKRNGVVYLDVHKLPERPQNELDRRRCYWGYSFENLATEESRRNDIDNLHPVDANVEFCAVIKTKLGAHRIIMGAEMDCYDISDNGRKHYIELKTNRELDFHTEERFEREKLLKFWIQSFIAGVPWIVVGFRDDHGRLRRTERLRVNDIIHRVKMKNYWQGTVCLAFADEVFCWLYGTVKDNEDYVLQYMPPSNRLELLQARSCPPSITAHLEQLGST
ncbi:decapping nuclease DXO homolog, chloroplastic [Amborella trichopoda]|uniref:Decapping nuclease n=1 Tax=Amborella trichopoda TaxID=13333 RepID=W1NTX6_AMBTC|nr:decapping nuclease DXO homolog, chloroplastic [Amborella trichopoda]ERN01052.1 hypothetical protein AMTR_s00002p00157480 [Amborella trichopoda]|eukprot:XP_006838483.1 decapping nuclease DXO homolog, chloroplastic [Amborella trichopoda]